MCCCANPGLKGETWGTRHPALKALIEREASRRLGALGGTMPELEYVPRFQAADRCFDDHFDRSGNWIDRFRQGQKQFKAHQSCCRKRCHVAWFMVGIIL